MSHPSKGQPSRATETAPHLPRLLRISHIIPDLIPISHASLWRWVREKRFPAPVKLSKHVTAWLASDVYEWIENKRAVISSMPGVSPIPHGVK